MPRFVLILAGPCYLPPHQQIAEEFLAEYLPDAHDGRGDITTTNSIEKARKFASIEEAQAAVNYIPVFRPLRSDGLPNRPIRAFTITFHQIEE